jgi:arabinofuranosyltransferase
MDERNAYKPASLVSYLKSSKKEVFPPHAWSREGLSYRYSKQVLSTRHSVGFYGYWAGVEKKIIDAYVLCDPFRARGPMNKGQKWRIGHFLRTTLPGYEQSLIQGRNLVMDPGMKL